MKLRYIIGTFIGAVLLSACDLMDGIDNIKPEYQLEEGNYITTPKSAEQALNGIYQEWRAWGISTFRVHISVMAGALGTTGGVSGIEGFSTNAVKVSNIAIKDSYSAFYSIVNASNYLIEALEANRAIGIDPTRNKEIIGECKFHRAMAHFMLLRQFGQFYNESSAYGIVLRKEPYRPTSPITARNNVADCYTFILQDLTDAGNTAPEMVDLHSRISRLTAKALKAKVLLYKKDYPQAATLAKEVIDAAGTYGYSLETGNWSQLFVQHYMNPETLFAPYTKGRKESCSISIDRTNTSSYTTGLSATWAAKAGTFENDPRFTATFQSGTAKTGNGKYPYATTEQNDLGNGYIFLRLAEIYLIHAEAEARQGQSHYAAARTSLKVITDRAGYPEDVVNNIPDNELLESIRQQKWLELMAESGEEWFDLVRYTQAGDLAWGKVQSTLKKEWQFILPIPEKALSGNKLLVQNPEY